MITVAGSREVTVVEDGGGKLGFLELFWAGLSLSPLEF